MVGASSVPHKFGNKAVRAYQRQGWTVYPVNPKEAGATIEGLRVYAIAGGDPGPARPGGALRAARVGVTLLEAIKAKAPKELFVNPGAESDELIAKAEALGLDPIQACAIVDIGERP